MTVAVDRFLGATAEFPIAHLFCEATLPVDPKEWPRVRAASIKVADYVAQSLPAASRIGEAARQLAGAEGGADPWSEWIFAIEDMHGVRAWPRRVEVGEGGLVRVWTGCPYPAPGEAWVRLAWDLVELGIRATRGESIRLDPDDWQAKLSRSVAGLPDARAIALHAALHARALPWVWTRALGTVAGSGSRIRQLRNAPDDAEEAARQLAETDPVIPIYTVTGSVGKTTTVRMLAELLGTAGLRMGMTASDGVWANGKCLQEGDSIGPLQALTLVRQPDIDLAVIELGRRGLIRRGMPFERTDVAVLINIDDVHIGIDGVADFEAMANVKALTLAPARFAVLNHDDPQCRRIGEAREPSKTIWFSCTSGEAQLRALSKNAAAAVGVARQAAAPAEIVVWREGSRAASISLEGVAPLHGMLGEKTLEELLAAFAAAWFGPVPIPDWQKALRELRLDGDSYRFRASVHRRGKLVFVLDKAAEEATLRPLQPAIEAICERYGVTRRVGAIARAAAEPPHRNRASCARLHEMLDEMIFFDRPETYFAVAGVPAQAVGSLPYVLKDEMERLNAAAGVDKKVTTAAGWAEAEDLLRARLSGVEETTLVLINQPGTAAVALNRSIVDFVESWPA